MKEDMHIKIAWDYFALHAGQRITVFNVFVVVSGAIAAAMGTALQTRTYTYAGALLGLMLCVVSLIFWKLDRRNASLIKFAEAALISMGEAQQGKNIFALEKEETAKLRTSASLVTRVWTFSECFGILFLFSALMGAGGIIIALSNVLSNSAR